MKRLLVQRGYIQNVQETIIIFIVKTLAIKLCCFDKLDLSFILFNVSSNKYVFLTVVFSHSKGDTSFLASTIVQSKEKADWATLGNAVSSENCFREAQVFQQFQCRYVLASMKNYMYLFLYNII